MSTGALAVRSEQRAADHAASLGQSGRHWAATASVNATDAALTFAFLGGASAPMAVAEREAFETAGSGLLLRNGALTSLPRDGFTAAVVLPPRAIVSIPSIASADGFSKEEN